MPKKKFSPTTLTRDLITQRAQLLRVRVSEQVPFPSFGEDMTVNVKGMTVADKNRLHFYQTVRGRDAMSVIAAICAIDEDGDMVFGETIDEAIERVESLPDAYRADIAAIAATAVRLSGQPADGSDPVEAAEKN